MARPWIWITGDIQDPSLALAAAWLHTAANCRLVSTADARANFTDSFNQPVAIVFLQGRPGALAQEVVEQFHHRAPLARLLAVAGPWCAGELRSGRPCEGVTRVYWHQWQARLPQELGLAGASILTGYRSRTLTETDVLLRTLTPALHRPLHAGHVAIAAASRESYSLLADACWATGWRCVWQQPATPPQYCGADLLLIDGWESCPSELAGKRAEHRNSPPSILLLDWPQQLDIARASELGIPRVLARPLLLTDLFATFDALLSHAPQVQRSRSAA